MTKEVRTTSSTGGQKGTKLARFDLIPPGPLRELAEHYGVGASKYADHNYRRGYEWSKSIAALARHFNDFLAGKDYDVCSNDPEGCQHVDAEGKPFTAIREDACFNHTGSHHMVAAAWHAFALLEFKDVHTDFDDRYRAPEPTLDPEVLLFFPSVTWDSIEMAAGGMTFHGKANALHLPADGGDLVEYGDDRRTDLPSDNDHTLLPGEDNVKAKMPTDPDALRRSRAMVDPADAEIEPLHGNLIPGVMPKDLETTEATYSYWAPPPPPKTNTEAVLRAAEALKLAFEHDEEDPGDPHGSDDVDYRRDGLEEAMRQYVENGADAKPVVRPLGPEWVDVGFTTEGGLAARFEAGPHGIIDRVADRMVVTQPDLPARFESVGEVVYGVQVKGDSIVNPGNLDRMAVRQAMQEFHNRKR